MANEGISLFVDKQGTKWIRVKILDEDFVLSTKDEEKEGRKIFNWEEAMEIAKKKKMKLPSKKQWLLIAAYKEEVEKINETAEGDSLDKDYWSGSPYNGYYIWLYYGTSGCLYNLGKCYGCRVRRLANTNELDS